MESLDIAMSKLVLIMILSYDNVRGEKGKIGFGSVVTGDGTDETFKAHGA